MKEYPISADLKLTLQDPEKDLDELYQLIDENRQDLARYLIWAYSETKEQLADFLNESQQAYLEGKRLDLLIRYKDAIVGKISFNKLNSEKKTAEIGYFLAVNARGKGFMHQAVEKICQIGFEEYGLEKIYLLAAVENIASCNVAKRAGFKFDQKLEKHSRLIDGQLHDFNQYVLER